MDADGVLLASAEEKGTKEKGDKKDDVTLALNESSLSGDGIERLR